MDIFNKKAKESEQTTGKLDDVFRALSPSALTAVAGVTALVGSIKALSGFVKQATANYAHFEEMQMGLETFYHDADKAKSKFEELRKLSNETTFGVDELTNAFTQLANVGVNTDTIESKLTMLGDIAQGDKNKFAELVSIYSKINATGKASSMQMQQLRLRGVPIDDMLKKMGKTGTATAKDITKAFENMTAEFDETTGKAGQFYNAMENINKTIVGKQGFISDYFKEFSVNFAEISGIADAYKKTLDLLKDAIGTVSDKLLEWNKNPVAKAIFQGVAITVIGSLVTGIGIGLVSAIKKLNAELLKTVALKSILDPKTLALAIGVGAIAGITFGIISYNKNLKEAEEETKKLTDETNRLANAWTNGTPTDKLDYAKNNLAIMESGYAKQLEDIKEVEQQIKDLDSEYTKLDSKGSKSTRDMLRMGNIGSQKSNLLDQLDQMQKRYLATNEIIEKQRKLVQGLQDDVDDLTQLGNLKKEFSDIFQTTLTKREKERAEIQKSLDTVLDYQEKLKKLDGTKDGDGNIISYSKEKDNIDKTINYLNNRLKGLSTWREVFENVTGIEVGSGTKTESAGLIAGKQYANQMNGSLATDKQLQDLFNPEKIGKYVDIYKSKMSQVQNDITKLMSEKKIDNPFTSDDASIKEMLALYDQYKNEYLKQDFNQQSETLDRELALLRGQTTELERQQELRRQALIDSGVSAENADALLAKEKEKTELEKKSTDIWGYLNDKVAEHLTGLGMSEENAQLFASTLTDIGKTQLPNAMVSSFNAIGKALATGADAGEALKKQFVDFVSQIMQSLSVTCIQAGVNLIAQSGWAGVPAALGLFALGGATGLAGGFISSLSDNSMSNEKNKELEQMKELTKAYEDLIKSVREQEEYYIRKKAELNMYALDDKVTKVNDMILTPNGRFSTNPNDTIIATKNPQGLGGGKVVNNIKVINNAGVDVQTSQRKNGDGMNEMLITISRKIASDVAGGYNGWDSAFAMQQQRISGRRI